MTHSDPAQADPDAGLEAFFAAGRRESPIPSAALSARVLQGGLAEQQARLAAPRPLGRAAGGLVGRMLAAVGGWGAATGLASAALAGLWLGFAPPASVAGWADGVLSVAAGTRNAEVDQVDLLPSFDSYLTEG